MLDNKASIFSQTMNIKDFCCKLFIKTVYSFYVVFGKYSLITEF